MLQKILKQNISFVLAAMTFSGVVFAETEIEAEIFDQNREIAQATSDEDPNLKSKSKVQDPRKLEILKKRRQKQLEQIKRAQQQKKKMTPSTTTVAPSAATPVVEAPVETKKEEAAAIAFGFGYEPTFYSQSKEDSNGNRAQYIEHLGLISATTKNYRLGVSLLYIDSVDAPENNTWDMTLFSAGLAKAWVLSEYFTLSPDVLVYAPIFMGSVSTKSMVGGTLTLGLRTENIGMEGFVIRYGLRFLKISQRNEVDSKGNATVSARLRQRVHLGYNFTSKFSWMNYFHFDSNFLFDDEVKNKFFHQSLFAYTFNDNFSLSFGHQNGGSLFKGQYEEINNLKYYDPDSSEFFVGLGFGF